MQTLNKRWIYKNLADWMPLEPVYFLSVKILDISENTILEFPLRSEGAHLRFNNTQRAKLDIVELTS